MNALQATTFLASSVVLIVVPGPNVLVIVSTSICDGPKQALWTVLGTSSAMTIQLLIAAIGTGWFVEFISNGFSRLKWVGVVYLIYLGIYHLTKLYSDNNSNDAVKGGSAFTRGFLVSLTNPKTIIFFSAFLPQFVSPDSDYTYQIIFLSLLFLAVATFFDSLYAILAGHVKGIFRGNRAGKLQHGVSGLLFLLIGVWLIVLRKA